MQQGPDSRYAVKTDCPVPCQDAKTTRPSEQDIKRKSPYLSSHSPGPPASSQCLLVTISLGTPAHTVPELDRTFGCRECHSACSLQTAVGRQVAQPSSCEFPLHLPLPTTQLIQKSTLWLIHGALPCDFISNQGLCSFEKSRRDLAIWKLGSIRVAIVRGGLSSKCDLG